MKRHIFLLFFFFASPAFLFSGRAGAQTPHPSFFELPSSNGFGSVHYSFHSQDHKIAAFYPHLYKQCDADAEFTPNLAYDMYFGIRTDQAVWLDTRPETRVEYEPGTNIIVTETTAPTASGDVTLRQYVFAPFELDRAAFVAVLELPGPVPPAALFALLNFHMGQAPDFTAAERVARSGAGFLESGGRPYVLYVRPLDAPAGVLAGSGASSPWQAMLAGQDYPSAFSSAQGDDLALGLQFNVPAGVPSQDVVRIAVVVGADVAERAAALAADVDAYVAGKTPLDLLEEARAGWTAFQARAQLPPGLSADEERLVRQGLVVMRMAQVREPNEGEKTPFGQILAALPKARPAPGEGIWNVAWVRDAAYAMVALARHGYVSEARAGLEFMLRARSGEYAQAVGMDYLISVCRYYGCGREETDYDHFGPNIEFDDFGLFLWAFSQTALATSEDSWWQSWWPAVREKVADVLAALVQDSTFLVAPDSSIWERHWNGNEKNFTYTSAVAIPGLCGAAALAERAGDAEAAERYRRAVSRLRRGIREKLVDGQGVLAGSLQELERGWGYLDLAAVEAFNFGAIEVTDPVVAASMSRWHADFFDGVENGNGGYFRNDDGDWYDQQEWCFVDLRMSTAYSYMGQTARRDALLAWVLGQSRENRYLMGELYCRGTVDCPVRGDYRGSVPMVGFGPGAYLLALDARANPDPPAACAPVSEDPIGLPDPDRTTGDPEDDDAGTDTDEPGRKGDSGCSCRTGRSSSGSAPFSWVLGILILVGRWRRRRPACRE